MAVATIGIVVIASAGGWVAGSQIQSPAEAAARVSPPSASPILVPVEERVLSTRIVARGTARFASPQQVTVARSELKVDPGLVSSVMDLGSELQEGAIALIASERPLFVLEGSVPSYRDLGPGMRGGDVLQLEQALVRLGHDPGPVDGVYDQTTASAVASWYSASGWQPFGPTPDQLATIGALEAEVIRLKIDRLAAGDSIAAAEAELAAMKAAAAAARDTRALTNDLVRAEEARSHVATQIAEAAARVAAGGMAMERVTQPSQVAVGGPGTDAPTGLLGAASPSASPAAEIAASDQALSVALAEAEATRLSGVAGVAVARNEAAAALRSITAADAAVAAATRKVTSARTLLTYLDASSSGSSSALDDAKLRTGIQVPADEVVFLPSMPVRLEETNAERGDQNIGPTFTVTGNQLSIDTSLPLDEAPLLRPGMRVIIDEPSLGLEGSGIVERVSDTPGTDGVDGFHVYSEIRVLAAPESIVGTSVRLTIPVESTGGAVLAVPISALTLAADGSSRVQVQRAGSLLSVPVKPGLVADGYVAIADAGGALKAGQLVVVGFDEPTVTNG